MAKDRKPKILPPALAARKRREGRAEHTRRATVEEVLRLCRTDGKTRDQVRAALAALPAWTPFEDVTEQLSSPLARAMGIDDPKVLLMTQQMLGTGNAGTRVFQNSRYIVHRTPTEGGGFQLSIRNLENDARHDWREFQRIKNELCGEDREAVELYPAETRLVDTSNQFYVHVLPPNYAVPVGFNTRLVMKPRPAGDPSGSNQRPWEAGTQPADAVEAPPASLDKSVYRRAIEALTQEQDRERGPEEDPEPEGDRQLHAARGTDERPEQLQPGAGEQPGLQPGERGEVRQGEGPVREDHQQVPGADRPHHREARGPAQEV
jgi:hypothetical protein